MSIVLYSNTGTEEDIKHAFEANGVTPIVEETKPSEETKKPEQTETPGDKVAVEETPGDKGAAGAAAESEPGKGPEEKSKQGESQEHKKGGGFQKKIERLTADKERLTQRLAEYEGVETNPKFRQMQEELAEAKAKLAEFKPAEVETKDQGPKKPKRPEMPMLDEFGYDQDKFSEAAKKYKADLGKYDDDLDKYNGEMSERKIQETLSRRDQEDATRKQQAEADRVYAEYETRRNKEKDSIDDWEETWALIPADAPTIFNTLKDGTVPPAQAFIISESSHPALLLHYFAKDFLENDGTENDRFGNMKNPIKMVLELHALEEKLFADLTKSANGQAPTEERKQPETPPAEPKKKIAKPPDAPLETVGGNADTAATGDLNKQMDAAAKRGDPREFQRLLALQHAQNQRARV